MIEFNRMAEEFHLAKKFAGLMDRNQYSDAALLMSEGCVYHYRGQIIQGRDQIIKIYVANYQAGSGKLDEIQFFSEVKPAQNGFFVLAYLDPIRKGKNWHEHRCEQRVRIEGNQISEIRHVDLPGESEALRSFFERNGIWY